MHVTQYTNIRISKICNNDSYENVKWTFKKKKHEKLACSNVS